MVQPITNIQPPPSLQVGFSNETILFISLLGFTILFASLACICYYSPSQRKYNGNNNANNNDDDDDGDDEYNQLLQDADVSTLNRAQRKARARLLIKKNKKKKKGAIANRQDAMDRNDNDDNNNNDNDDNNNDDGNNNEVEPIVDEREFKSRKERQKASKQEEKMVRRQYEELRKSKLKEEEELGGDDNDDDESGKHGEVALQMKKEQMELEHKKIREEEMRSWKYMFPESTVDSNDNDGRTVNEFVKDLYEKKKVNINDIADRFQVSIDKVISRLQQLEKEGRIDHGILDEKRMEYYCINGNDMYQIVERIRVEGVVSIDDVIGMIDEIVETKRDKDDA